MPCSNATEPRRPLPARANSAFEAPGRRCSHFSTISPRCNPRVFTCRFLRTFHPRCVCTRRRSTKRKSVSSSRTERTRRTGNDVPVPAVAAARSRPDSAIRIEVEVASPHPPGMVQASALLGPWKGAASPLSGSISVTGADLSKYEALEGVLTGSGKFGGPWRRPTL